MDHMNVMWYTARFDEATWHLFNLIGITPSYMRKNKKGMAGVQQDTTYKQELFSGDLISVWSKVLEIRERVIRFHHEMRNEETRTVAATTTLTAVHLDRVAHKACPFPKEILKRSRRLITG
jgi:acyl-CoA thioester hydrolase